MVGSTATQQRAGVMGDLGADALAQPAQRLVVELPVGEVLTGQPPGAERERPRHVGDLVVATGDLERAATDVEDREAARGPAEPPAYGEEGQPRLVLARQHLDRDTGALLHVGEHSVAVARVAHRRRGEGVDLLAALVL